MGWASGRTMGWLSGQRRTEASFEVFERMTVRLTGRRMKVSSEARYESYETSGPGFAGRMWNCSAFLGPFLRWALDH